MYDQAKSVGSSAGSDLAAKSNQTERELSTLGNKVQQLINKVSSLEERLQPLMTNPPTAIISGKAEAEHLVPLANNIRDSRLVVDDVNDRLEYILDNIQI